MTILNELEPIKENMHNLSLGEIIRGTRDLMGLKQWKLASLLGVSIPNMKLYECNGLRSKPSPELVLRFSDLFGYDEKKVWKQAIEGIEKHKKEMQIFGKHPYYAKRQARLENLARGVEEDIALEE